jgi:3-hydroxymyristoyl/3-hydroxydecanoyl-(acyl carrier protein) dehydratase
MRWCLVDKITEIIPWQKAKGIKAVSFEEYSLKKRWGEKGSLPHSLLIESILQLGSWLCVYSSGFTIQPLIVKIGEINFKDIASMGSILELETEIISKNEEGIIMSGKAFSSGKLIIEGKNAVGIFRDLKEFQNPRSVKSLFNQIFTEQIANA